MFRLKFCGVFFLCVALPPFSGADKFCRQGLFKKVQEGECMTTNNTISLHVGSMSDCSHQCLKEETCVVFKYRSSTQNCDEANCKLGQKLESSCSQIDTENKDRTWEVYKSISVKPAVCLEKSVCQNGGECIGDPCKPHGFKCVCRKYFAGKFCEQRTGYHSSCKSLLQTETGARNGAYKIKTNTTSAFSNIYCQMTSLPGCSGGGWTLVMKMDGDETTFTYNSSHWWSHSTYNLVGGITAFDEQETKLPTYWSTSFTELCVGMKFNGSLNFVAINYSASSLYSLIADGKYRATNTGRQKWKSLIANSALQSNCGKEGFNINIVDHAGIRLGIIGNEQNDCISPDSFLGFGGKMGTISACPFYVEGQLPPIACGNAGACFNNIATQETFIATMGYILVR